jgi:hypothetical protein
MTAAVAISFGITAMRFEQIAKEATAIAKQATELAAECSAELTSKIIGTKAEWCAKCEAETAADTIKWPGVTGTCIYREVRVATWSMIDECGRDQRIEMDGSGDWRLQ